MPRVTPEHTAARRQQILDAAHVCFLRDGFHQTSMTDIQRESGLSAGAIYLYFKSKDDIILGLASEILETVGTILPVELPETDQPLDVSLLVAGFLHNAHRLNQERQVFPIVIQIWGEANRNPRLRERLMEDLDQLRAQVERLVTEWQAKGVISTAADPPAIALALIGIGQAYLLQSSLLGPGILDDYVNGIRALLGSAETGDADRSRI